MWNPPRGPCCARHAFLCTHTEAGERQVQVGVLPFIWLSPRASVPNPQGLVSGVAVCGASSVEGLHRGGRGGTASFSPSKRTCRSPL